MTPEELRSFSELHPSYFFNTPILRACIPRSVQPLTEWRDDLRYLAPEKDTPRCWLCCRSRLRSAIASLTRLASSKSSVPHTRRTTARMCIPVSVVSRRGPPDGSYLGRARARRCQAGESGGGQVMMRLQRTSVISALSLPPGGRDRQHQRAA